MTTAPAPQMLSAAEAAALLGVSRATLYAYVSRGMVVSEPGPGPSRARRYPRAAIEAFMTRRERGRDPGLAAHDALHRNMPVLDSALTLIAGGRCHYRGHDVVQLSRSAPIEEVARLLWGVPAGEGDDIFGAGGPAPPGAAPSADALARHLGGARGDSLPAAGAADAAAWRAAGRVVDGLAGAVGATGGGRLARRLARGWGIPDAGALDAALVLSADHELNVSAFTARCVASAGAGLEDVVLAGLCALRGRRHGGMTAAAEAMVRDAARIGAPGAAERAAGPDGALPGFGHPLYPEGDPRATELLWRAAALPGPAADAAAIEALVALGAERPGRLPNLDLGLAALSFRLGLPEGSGLCLFALGRSVGWIAHALEARADGRLIRPRSRYTGPPPVGASTA